MQEYVRDRLLIWKNRRYANRCNIGCNLFLLGLFLLYNVLVLVRPGMQLGLDPTSHLFYLVVIAFCIVVFLIRVIRPPISTKKALLLLLLGLVMVNLVQFYFLFEYVTISSVEQEIISRIFLAAPFEEALRTEMGATIYMVGSESILDWVASSIYRVGA